MAEPARNNLARTKADIDVPGVYLEDLCFDAQQAAEKAIKAVLISLNVRFPYVHDLATLLHLIEQSGLPLPQGIKEADELTHFAFETRYPGPQEPVTRNEYESAVVIAEAVVRWAEERLLGKPE